jgi:hypothetical protein
MDDFYADNGGGEDGSHFEDRLINAADRQESGEHDDDLETEDRLYEF